MLDPVNQHATRGDQPQQRIHQIDPNRVLHALNAIIIRSCVNVHLSKDTEEGDPQDEEDQVPNEEEGNARDEGDEVEGCGDGGEGGSYFCVSPFSIAIFVLSIRLVQIYAIQAADCEGEDELAEAVD